MLKQTLKAILVFLKIDLTKNLKYDRLTKQIFKQELGNHSNCIDIGCHKGEVLDEILKISPEGLHLGFEPIPDFYKNLDKKYINNTHVSISNLALSDCSSSVQFNYVKNAPAYSGLKTRKYDTANPDVQKIDVKTQKLDDFLESSQITNSIDLIKIDVEGAEMLVLKGAEQTIIKNKPIIIFEFGLGASDYYNVTPEDLYTMVKDKFQMKLSTLSNFLNKKNALTSGEFKALYSENKEYYFIIHQ